jgi:DNA-directed RNA polymerase
MSQSIREAFKWTFENHCPYTELLEQTLARLDQAPQELPTIPERKNLDLSEVLLSDYAFS